MSTTLSVGSADVASTAANCFEATFPTDGFSAGVHIATVSTPWGTADFGLTVLPVIAPPTPTQIDVKRDYAGDLRRALAYAGTLPAATAKIVELGEGVYSLSNGIAVPANTTVVGAGATATQLVFEIEAVAPPPRCGAAEPADFYVKGCVGSCWHDKAEFDNASSSPADCCAKCKASSQCTGFTHQWGQARGWICLLKACTTELGAPATDCPTTTSVPNTTTSARFARSAPLSAAAITVASDVRLDGFLLTITDATSVAQFAAVSMPATSQRFKATALSIEMQQDNVSNAFKLFGTQFEIGSCVVEQNGRCPWPGYGPGSDATPFQPSTTIYMMGASDGWVHDNTFYWRYS